MKRQCHTVSNPLNYSYSNSEINLYSNIHSSLQKTVSLDSLNNSNRNSPLKIQSKINVFSKNNYNVLMNLNNQEENNHTLKSRLNANNSCLLPDLMIRPSKPKRPFKIPQKFVLLRQEKDRLNDFKILSKRSKLPPVKIVNEKKRQEMLKSTKDDNEDQIVDTARKFNYTVLKNIEMNDALQFEKVHTNKGIMHLPAIKVIFKSEPIIGEISSDEIKASLRGSLPIKLPFVKLNRMRLNDKNLAKNMWFNCDSLSFTP